ncbi:hypothetical protein [Salininema proteolyticum]|uniref:Uncharacterized protein n=1 Tax=Salininema proteolyticum TaxID=1607685 RepID=A0ABV8TW76_9ACTN
MSGVFDRNREEDDFSEAVSGPAGDDADEEVYGESALFDESSAETVDLELPDESAEADAVEQRVEVPVGEEDEEPA